MSFGSWAARPSRSTAWTSTLQRAAPTLLALREGAMGHRVCPPLSSYRRHCRKQWVPSTDRQGISRRAHSAPAREDGWFLGRPSSGLDRAAQRPVPLFCVVGECARTRGARAMDNAIFTRVRSACIGESLAHSVQCGLCAVGQMELVQNVADVGSHRPLTHHESVRDLFVGHSLRNQPQDLDFAL